MVTGATRNIDRAIAYSLVAGGACLQQDAYFNEKDVGEARYRHKWKWKTLDRLEASSPFAATPSPST